MTKVTTAATTSEIGIAHHTPSTPYIGGRMANIGRRNINCRDRDRNMLTLAMPMLWKKLVTTI